MTITISGTRMAAVSSPQSATGVGSVPDNGESGAFTATLAGALSAKIDPSDAPLNAGTPAPGKDATESILPPSLDEDSSPEASTDPGSSPAAIWTWLPIPPAAAGNSPGTPLVTAVEGGEALCEARELATPRGIQARSGTAMDATAPGAPDPRMKTAPGSIEESDRTPSGWGQAREQQSLSGDLAMAPSATAANAGAEALQPQPAAAQQPDLPAPHSAASVAEVTRSSVPAPVQPDSKVLTVHTPAGSNAWVTELHNKVSLLVDNHASTAELRMTPPDMGSISIRIDFSDLQAQVVISAQHADTRDALDAALPRLRELLADNGIALGGAGVNSQDHQESTQSPERGLPPAARELILPGAISASAALRHIPADRMVDTYA